MMHDPHVVMLTWTISHIIQLEKPQTGIILFLQQTGSVWNEEHKEIHIYITTLYACQIIPAVQKFTTQIYFVTHMEISTIYV